MDASCVRCDIVRVGPGPYVLSSLEHLTNISDITVSYMGASPGPGRRSEAQKAA